MAAENLDKLEEWAKYANEQLNTITSKIKEMEGLLENLEGDNFSLLEFVKNVDHIQERYQRVVMQAMSSKSKDDIDSMKKCLEQQMQFLAVTLQLLEIDEDTS